MTIVCLKRRLDRLDHGRADLHAFDNVTDDQLDDLIAEQLDARGILKPAAYLAMPRVERWRWLDTHKEELRR